MTSTDQPPRKRRKKGLFALAALVGLGALSAGVLAITSALFSDTTTGSVNLINSGTVTVGPGTASSVVCAVTNLVPGDSSSGHSLGSKARTQCKYSVKYTGTAPAYLAVDLNVAAGTTPLYTNDSVGLRWLIRDGTTTYVNGHQYVDQDDVSHTITAGTPVTNLLVSTTPASTDDEVVFTVDYLLPTTAGNAYQAGATSVQLTFHAVQSGNQTLPAACAAGQQCAGLVWS